MIRGAGALMLSLAAGGVSAAAGEAGFSYVRAMDSAAARVIVDVRPRAACEGRTVSGARCLPAADFLGPHRRLASWRDILWLLGTAGLRGDESVLVIGEEPTARDFVAGLLHLAGQREVRVLTEPVPRLLAAGTAAGAGRPRDFARAVVFEAPMRDALVVMGSELAAAKPLPALLDGRASAEYWGEIARASRAGHLPGAISLPAAELRAAAGQATLPEGKSVAYGHDALEGIAYFTLLRAGHGVDARVYPEGWAEWAAHGDWPADAVSYPEAVHRPAAAVTAAPPAPTSPGSLTAGALMGALGLAAIAFAAGLGVGRCGRG